MGQTNTGADQVTLLGKGTVFEGTLQVEHDFRAHGRIVGTLEVEGKAMIAEEGAVEGDLIATDAEIAGYVQGEIHVGERLVLKSTARIDGKIETDQLIVEEGAQFAEECKMGAPTPESVDAGEKEQQNREVRQDEREATAAELPEEVAVA